MICISLKGGMDHADTVLPYNQQSYEELTRVRASLYSTYQSTANNSNRNRSNLSKLNPVNAANFGGREFALPPALSSVHQMFEEGDLAILGSTGPLLEPTTRDMISNGSVLLLTRLFSHNDQQDTWMSLSLEGKGRGWGGKFLDASLASSPGSNKNFAALSPASNDVFLFGNSARPYRISPAGVPSPVLLDTNSYIGSGADNDEARTRLRSFLAKNGVMQDNIFSQVIRNGQSSASQLSEFYANAASNASPISTGFASDDLSQHWIERFRAGRCFAESEKLRYP